jgi:two-component system NtrC family sensor kinase
MQLDPHLPQAMVDRHQIQQVFVNVLNNARQAIEVHSPKGWIRITSDTAGGNVRITMQDSGPGIPDGHLSKVFDPFFTTKDVGKGTGLGLSLCYGIVKEHGGRIHVRSRPGEGATFIVELPIAAPAEESPEEAPKTDFPRPITREGAGKRVLVIDDEEPILQMLSDALGECGYAVDTESSGEAALQRLARTNYDLTLCDWKMPGLNGRQIYERLQTVNPTMSERMIFITGDVINERTQKFLQDRNKLCLGKPFSLEDFRAAVHQATAVKS